jgi:RNA polymerase sigma-70 factor (sigma-E family)
MTQEAETFVRALYPQVRGLLQLHTGDRDLADELTQETLARVWERWSRVNAMASPHGYAYRIALNLARSWFRRRSRERRAIARLGPVVVVDEPAAAERLAIREAVLGLSRRQREVVLLRYYAGLSVDETADVLRCAPGTVKTHTHRALAHLGAQLNEADEHDGPRRHRPATSRGGRHGAAQ